MKQHILVIGASGFVGGHLAQQLLAEGHHVRCLVRTPAKTQQLAAAGADIRKGDMLDPASLHAALAGVTVVYVSVQTLVPQANQGKTDFMDLELQGLRNIVAACRAHGVTRLLYITFLGVAETSPSAWVRGRWAAEQLLLKSGLNVTILRPGMIVGKGGQGFDMLAANAAKKQAVIMGSGKKKFRPIAVSDLVYYLTGAMDESSTFGHCYDVGNDDVLSMDSMIDITAGLMGRPRPRKLHIPWGLIGFAAPLIERMSGAPKGAIKGMTDGMHTDMIGDPRPIRQILRKPLLSYVQAAENALRSAGIH